MGQVDVMAWVAVEPDVHTHVELGRSQHAVATITDPQDVAGPLQCGKVACLVLNVATVTSWSTMGLAARPGATVDPMCSMLIASGPRAVVIVAGSMWKRAGGDRGHHPHVAP